MGNAARRHGVKLRLKVATYNIHRCIGVDGRFDAGRILAVLIELDADIVALQEADMRFGDRQGLLDLATLQSRSGYRAVADIGSRATSHGFHGNVVLYRGGSVKEAKRIKLPGLEPRGAIVVDLNFSKGNLRVIGAHLGLLKRSRSKQIAAILKEARPTADRPVILLGDLNEWRVGPRSSLKMFGPHFGPVHSSVVSFPAHRPIWPLDRILASPGVSVLDVAVHDSPLASVASDHLPIKAIIETKFPRYTSDIADGTSDALPTPESDHRA